MWAFEKILRDAEPGGRGDGEKRDLLEKAISLYKGHFLPADAREPWTMSIRERLRSKYLRLVARLGEQWMEAKQHQKAIDLLEHGLEIDELAEEFYQQLMLCYRSLGQEAGAVKVYHRCRVALSESLGVEPSSKTEEIFSSLRLKR
jgi:two-component SAPR family response regulator